MNLRLRFKNKFDTIMEDEKHYYIHFIYDI